MGRKGLPAHPVPGTGCGVEGHQGRLRLLPLVLGPSLVLSLVSRCRVIPHFQPSQASQCPVVKPELLAIDPNIPLWPCFLLTPQTRAISNYLDLSDNALLIHAWFSLLECFTSHFHLTPTNLPFKTWVKDTSQLTPTTGGILAFVLTSTLALTTLYCDFVILKLSLPSFLSLRCLPLCVS